MNADLLPELTLLLACCRYGMRNDDPAQIRRILDDGIDWTTFARLAMDHGLAGLAGQSMGRAAPDLVPDDILGALQINRDQTQRRNLALFRELAVIIDALANRGVDAIPFKGPILAIEAYRDLGLRVFRDLDFLIRDHDLARTGEVLQDLAYQREQNLTAAQIAAVQRLQGQEILFGKTTGTAIEPHTRLTPIQMAFDLDYDGLWSRAGRRVLNGHKMLLLAPEDTLTVLAIHGGKEMWWNLKWVCDVAAFIASHPSLDWAAVVERARTQGCLRMVLLAGGLAERCFGPAIPDSTALLWRSDPAINKMIGRIVARWQADGPAGPPSNKTVSADRLRLHDGALRRARYIAKTVFLPGPHHVAAVALPRGMMFAYIPFKLVHDMVALPLWRVWEHAARLGNGLSGSAFAFALLPRTAEAKAAIGQHRSARAAAMRLLASDPHNATAWSNLGDALSGLKRHRQAIASYDRALAIAPDNIFLLRKRAALAGAAGEIPGLGAPPQDPQSAKAWAEYAGRLFGAKRYAEAAEASDNALSLDPAHTAAMRLGIQARLHSCDWRKREDDTRQILEATQTGRIVITPYLHRAICDSESEFLAFAQLLAKGQGFPKTPPLPPRNARREPDRIRIGYLSTETHDATTHMIAAVFEHHDKSRFETTAISLGLDDGSKMRHRVRNAFERFISVHSLSDDEAVARLRTLELDIIVDLKGNAGDRRTGILARRAAPVQVNYLGYPGTMAVPFIDYIIADRMIIPPENRVHYSEKVVYLPNSFMATDNTRQISPIAPNRFDAGLPESGFVFASFNYSYKLDPGMFDIWMRLLRAAEGSVLWLRATDPAAFSNLRREARARDVAPERILFAPFAPHKEDYFARLGLADLFLDTLPFNAHATAVDALWSGLPVLTCPGNHFAGRVAASLLNAIGMPELIAHSLPEYEQIALALARDPERLRALKAKLLRNRDTHPLFDSAQTTRALESAYIRMWEREQQGLPPESFSVDLPPTVMRD